MFDLWNDIVSLCIIEGRAPLAEVSFGVIEGRAGGNVITLEIVEGTAPLTKASVIIVKGVSGRPVCVSKIYYISFLGFCQSRSKDFFKTGKGFVNVTLFCKGRKSEKSLTACAKSDTGCADYSCAV